MDELELVAQLCVEHDLVAVTDEVYEHLVFDGRHVPLATFPGMRDRTVTISSGGKTFSCTGWKVGWVCAPPDLVDAVKTVKQFLTYVNGGPFQYGDRGRVGAARVDVPPARGRRWRRSATGCPPGWPPPGSPCCRRPGPTS